MRKLTTALVFILIAGGGVFAYYKWGRTVEKPSIIQTAVTAGPLTEIVQATGTLEALRTVNVGAQVSGTVSALYADYNSMVKTGQIIAELDPSLLKTQVKVQEANVDKQQTDIDANEIGLVNDQRNLDRTQQQFDAHLVSQQVLDQAILAVKTRQSTIESGKKMLVTLQQSLKQAQLNVDYCTIRSPIDGVVVQRAVDIGQTVQSSMTTPTFFQVAQDLSTLRIDAGVDEADIGKIRPNQDVTFMVDAYPQQVFTGKVDRVRLNAVSSNNVVTYQVTANVDNKDLKLRPAMTAQLRVIIQTKSNVLRVSNQALRFKPTADMYAALGSTMPPPSQGRGGRGGGGGDNSGSADQSQNRRNGGGGFGQGVSSMTPEQRQQLMSRYGGGRGGRGNGSAANQTPVPIVERATEAKTDKIDDLFSPLRQNLIPGQVYVWNESTKELKRLNVMVGITDGQQTEISGGGLKAGDEIVTSILVPVSLRSLGGSPLMGNQPRGQGPGGFPQGGRPGGGGGGGGRGGN